MPFNIDDYHLGVLMLDTRFPRIRGDIGNADSFPHRVSYRTLSGASASRIVRGNSQAILPQCLDEALALEASGVDAITTSCGFLITCQADIQPALTVPFFSSALQLCAPVENALGGQQQVGIITIDADALSDRHLAAACARPDTPMVSVSRDGALASMVFEDRITIDVDACLQDVLNASGLLMERYGNIGAIVLECTNMGPYQSALAAHSGLPVYSILDLCRP